MKAFKIYGSENQIIAVLRVKALKQVAAMVKDVTPVASETYSVGAIVSDNWGSEQTNVDFYAVIARKGAFVTIQKLKSDRVNTPGMSSKNTPGGFDLTETPIRKKVKTRDGKEIGFSLRDYAGGGWVSLWNGKALTATHYA